MVVVRRKEMDGDAEGLRYNREAMVVQSECSHAHVLARLLQWRRFGAERVRS